jgi:integrase
MRRGEMLSLKIRQVEFPLARATIIRNQDDKADPRRRQPAAKSYGRLVPLERDLAALTQRYIKERSKIEVARKHGFLFVSDAGKPLQLSALTQIFVDLRKTCPTLGPLTAHVLRHTWNEVFSDEAAAIGMDPDEERRVRIELMGWSPTSTMPDYYLRRSTIAKGMETSKSMQRRLMHLGEEANKRIAADDKTNR